MRNKKLAEMLQLLVDSCDAMMKDEQLQDWTAERLLTTAYEVTMNEYSAKGKGQPIATVDTTRVAFCFHEDETSMDVAVIAGEGFLDDEN